jgi:hypothetical protein
MTGLDEQAEATKLINMPRRAGNHPPRWPAGLVQTKSASDHCPSLALAQACD